jgi:putative endonuclease
LGDQELWYVYVLQCKGDRLYCGIAKDVNARFAEHAAGKGAKFARAFPPTAIVVAKAFVGRSAALRAESAFKALNKAAKQEQIAAWMSDVH